MSNVAGIQDQQICCGNATARDEMFLPRVEEEVTLYYQKFGIFRGVQIRKGTKLIFNLTSFTVLFRSLSCIINDEAQGLKLSDHLGRVYSNF